LYKNDNPVESAVTIIFYSENEKINIIFIKRKEDGKAHGGQVAFPGGKFEKEDNKLIYTAIRETFEEIGIKIHKNQIIGQLTPIFIPVSNFKVTPFIAYLDYKPEYLLSENEVDKIITAEIHDLFGKENTGTKFFNRNNIQFTAPYFRANGDIVWGATAMILSELKEIIIKSKMLEK